MKKYYYLIILLFLSSCKTKKQEEVKQKKAPIKKQEEAKPVKVEQNFYTSFKGEIDNEEAFMFLANIQGKLSGGYYYSFQVNEFFDLKGTIDSLGNIELTEQENKIEIAKWTGIFKDKETIKLERVLFEDKSKMLASFSSFKLCNFSFLEQEKRKEIKKETDSSELIISYLTAEGCQPENQENMNYLINKEFIKYLKVKSLEEKIKKFHAVNLYDDTEPNLLIKETEEHKIKELKSPLLNVLSLTFSSYNFIYGSPYPNTYFKTIHINKENNQLLKESDFINQDKRANYNSLLEKEFLMQKKQIEGGVSFKLPTDFVFTSEGLVYKFNINDLGPHALGSPLFIISYSKLLPFLSENHLAQRIKVFGQSTHNN